MTIPPTSPVSEPPQQPAYKAGDIVNGHRLTIQPDGSYAWLPLLAANAPASNPVPPLKRRPVQIALGALGVFLVICIAVGAAGAKPRVTDPLTSSTEREEAVEKPPKPTAEPEPEQIMIVDVTGMSVPLATTTLIGLGFKVASGADSEGTVTGTVPVAGSLADDGSTIVLSFTVPPKLTLAQENAVRKSQDYLDYSAFSRSGLIAQLEYEGYPTDVATFAVDYNGTDWNVQAGLKAADYMAYSAFSPSGLYDQLVYEGFSDAEATAGLAAVGY